MREKGRRSLADAQAAASVGQIALARLWSEALAEHDLVAAQMLLTLDDLEDRRRYLNASATLARLLEAGVVPVINENDSVATEEIRFGDNDRLGARVAQAAQADAVLLLSDVDGLFDRDPAQEGSTLLPLVETVDDAVLNMGSPVSGSGIGSGGMASKLEAARNANRAGIALVVANGTVERPLDRVTGDGVGTLFLADDPKTARKSWLGGRLAAGGAIVVDGGCAAALADGASLLAPGVTSVSGKFGRGDLVTIMDGSGAKLAQGLTEYDAGECRAIAGMRRAGGNPRPCAAVRRHPSRPHGAAVTIAITGGTGFVGQALIDLAEWYDVPLRRSHGVCRKIGEAWVGTGRPPMSPLARMVEGADAVIHIAGQVPRDPGEFEAANVAGTLNVVEAALAAGVKRFVSCLRWPRASPRSRATVPRSCGRRNQ